MAILDLLPGEPGYVPPQLEDLPHRVKYIDIKEADVKTVGGEHISHDVWGDATCACGWQTGTVFGNERTRTTLVSVAHRLANRLMQHVAEAVTQ